MSRKRSAITTYHINPFPPYNRIIDNPPNDDGGGEPPEENEEQQQFRTFSEPLSSQERQAIFCRAVVGSDFLTIRKCLVLPEYYDKNWYIGAGSTALHWWIDCNNLDGINLLLHFNVRASNVDLYGRSALTLALHNGYAEIIRTMMRYAIKREYETQGEDFISMEDFERLQKSRIMCQVFLVWAMEVKDASRSNYLLKCLRAPLPPSIASLLTMRTRTT